MIPTKFPCKMRSRATGRVVVITEITDVSKYGPDTGAGYYAEYPGKDAMDFLTTLPGYTGGLSFDDFNLNNFEEIKEH